MTDLAKLKAAAEAVIKIRDKMIGKDWGELEGWDAVNAEWHSFWRNHCQPKAILALIASHEALVEATDAMVDAYWRGSEDSEDEFAPGCVKKALSALETAHKLEGK